MPGQSSLRFCNPHSHASEICYTDTHTKTTNLQSAFPRPHEKEQHNILATNETFMHAYCSCDIRKGSSTAASKREPMPSFTWSIVQVPFLDWLH